MAAKRQVEGKKLVAELNALGKELAGARKPWSLKEARAAFERQYVQYIIAISGGRSKAADRLDIGYSTLKEKIRRPGKWRWTRVD